MALVREQGQDNVSVETTSLVTASALVEHLSKAVNVQMDLATQLCGKIGQRAPHHVAEEHEQNKENVYRITEKWMLICVAKPLELKITLKLKIVF